MYDWGMFKADAQTDMHRDRETVTHTRALTQADRVQGTATESHRPFYANAK